MQGVEGRVPPEDLVPLTEVLERTVVVAEVVVHLAEREVDVAGLEGGIRLPIEPLRDPLRRLDLRAVRTREAPGFRVVEPDVGMAGTPVDDPAVAARGRLEFPHVDVGEAELVERVRVVRGEGEQELRVRPGAIARARRAAGRGGSVGNPCWRRQRNHSIAAHVRCAPLAETVTFTTRFQQRHAARLNSSGHHLRPWLGAVSMNWEVGQEGRRELVSEIDRRGKRLHTVICMETGLVRNDPIPDDEELAQFYAENYRLAYKGTRQLASAE